MTMTLHVFVNSRLVGTLEYELPKDARGNEIPLPRPADPANQVGVVIVGPEGQSWQGHTTLARD